MNHAVTVIDVLVKEIKREATANPPKVKYGHNTARDFLCVLCNWLLNIPYQFYCGDRACYKCLKLLAQKMKQR